MILINELKGELKGEGEGEVLPFWDQKIDIGAGGPFGSIFFINFYVTCFLDFGKAKF